MPGAPDEKTGIAPGDIVGGRFRIGRRLGAGGMGTVYAATHIELGETYALKFLNRGRDAATVQRFLREARASARLKDEHVVRVFDVGRTDSGDPFMVMEYLDGRPLEASPESPLGASDAASYALQICQALADAHARGIVHRDLKPANVLLARSSDGRARVKVLDFGISKITDGEGSDSQLTTTGAIMGSPSYTAPEQILDPKSVDARADVWGIGVTFYTLLAGARPFAGDTPIQTYMMVLNATPVPLAELRPDLPPELASAFMRCLEKDRAARWNDVAELALALEPFAGPTAVGIAERVAHRLADRDTSPPALATSEPRAPGHSVDLLETANTTTRDEAPPMARQISSEEMTVAPWEGAGAARSRRRAWIGLAAVGCVVGGFGVTYALGSRPTGPTGPELETASASAAPSLEGSASGSAILAAPAASIPSVASVAERADAAAMVAASSAAPVASSPPARRPAPRFNPVARDPRSYR